LFVLAGWLSFGTLAEQSQALVGLTPHSTVGYRFESHPLAVLSEANGVPVQPWTVREHRYQTCALDSGRLLGGR
jgi:hypothetical protein